MESHGNTIMNVFLFVCFFMLEQVGIYSIFIHIYVYPTMKFNF